MADNVGYFTDLFSSFFLVYILFYWCRNIVSDGINKCVMTKIKLRAEKYLMGTP